MQASRYCPLLEELELTHCQGSRSFKGLAYLPLLKLAQNCRGLRQAHFRDTDFLCSRVFKVSPYPGRSTLQGPGLQVGVWLAD